MGPNNQTLDFMLSAKRGARAAKRFFRKVIQLGHAAPPPVMNVDKNPAFSIAFDDVQADGIVL